MRSAAVAGRRFAHASIGTLLCATAALAGPNADGTLLLHHNAALSASCGAELCGHSALESCRDAVVRIDGTPECAAVFVLAAFPPWRDPSVRQVSFGLDYAAPNVVVFGVEGCGDHLVQTDGWPLPGTGASIAWNVPKTERLLEVCAFLAYGYDTTPSEIRLTAHPTDGATFTGGDYSLDPIAALGVMGWNRDGAVACPPDQASPGACCFSDQTCLVLQRLDCLAQAGRFLGYGSACEPGVCDLPSGACCLPDDQCEQRTRFDCESADGTYYGDGHLCTTYLCTGPPPPIGACCFSAEICQELSSGDCTADGGVYLGNGTHCTMNGCADAPGACCSDNGACHLRTATECAQGNGIFHGAGVSCAPNPCTPQDGACCLLSATCIQATPQECSAAHGHYHGRDSICEPGLCPIVTGACCLPDLTCVVLQAQLCAYQGGSYLGDGQICVAGACDLIEGCGPEAMRYPASEGSGSVAVSLGIGHGSLLAASGSDEPCGETLMSSDGSYENGYSWQYGGVARPMFGALAECYQGRVTVCSVDCDFSGIGIEAGSIDVFVWDDESGCPGAVLCVRMNFNPGTVAFWPSVSRHRASMPNCCTGDAWWVGYWGDWPGQMSGLYVGADLDGPGGCPKTCIAPGLGFPSGWQSVDVVWGPTSAMGIGADVLPCAPVAIEKKSWGQVKVLYAR